MAGHVTKKLLVKPEVDPILLDGTTLWKWEEGTDNLHKLTFRADKDGFFLYAKGDERTKAYESYMWDLALVSDVRSGKPPKDAKVQEALSSLIGCDTLEDYSLMLVSRRDGIVNIDYTHLVCDLPEVADRFKRAINALAFNMLNAHAAPCVLQRKSYVKILIHANSQGQIYLKYIHKVLMLKNKQEIDDVNQLLASFNLVKLTEDGIEYTTEEKFTEEIFLRVVDRLLHSRTDDIDVILSTLARQSKMKHTIGLEDFHKFLNHEQRDPRLNEILFPLLSKPQARKMISEHESGKSDERLTSRGLMSYLMSEENNIFDVEHLSQHHDMNHPLTHYFINSSHNTYLTGHQLRSSSTSEMYIQCLLLGCRCVELDCWPSNDGEDIVITHGGTLCGRVSFQGSIEQVVNTIPFVLNTYGYDEEVVEAINEFAFVTSDYPVILSIENHCKSKPLLIQRMANIFITTFGDKLVSRPIEGYPLEAGVRLPSPEMLKGKILLKDKIRRQKDTSTNTNTSTLPKGAHVPPEGLSTVPEEDKAKPQQNGEANGSQNGSAAQKKPSVGDEAEEGGLGLAPSAVNNGETKKGENPGATGTEIKPPEGGTDEKPPEETEEASGKPKAGRSSSLVPSEESVTSLSGTPVHKKGSAGTAEQLGIKDLEKIYRAKGRSEADTMIAGPLVELLNYCTGISFEGFASAERLNCAFYQSSFVEEKGYNFIKSTPKDFVKYNMRQLSRVYPQGSRFNSSNYMPQIYWNVGCHLVALNYQTSDLPMQLNGAKFELNGATGYIQKPWVMVRELSKSSGGTFNPFIQSKLEDIVPAKLSLKIISGYFLTDKRTNCFVEAELYGLPADTVRHKFYTRRVSAPHPFWNEEPFTFKRILLPELAMLRVAVFDDDKELVGQRFLPVNAIRPGFRHITLRTRHNDPISLAMLFVYIKVEDWVPNELEDIVAMLMDPIQFASKALEELAKADDFEETDEQNGDEAGAAGLEPSSAAAKRQPSPLPVPKRGPADVRKTSAPNLGIPTQLPSSSAIQSPSKAATFGAVALSGFDDTLPSLEKAKLRLETIAVAHDSKLVLEHPKYLKLAREGAKRRVAAVKKHEKALKQQRSKQGKQKWGSEVAAQKATEEMEAAQQAELLEYDRAALTECHSMHKQVLEEVHSKQLEEMDRVHKSDLAQMNKELVNTMKKHRKNSDIADKKAGMRDIEDKTIRLGKKMRNEFEKIHSQELTKLRQKQKEAVTAMTELHNEEQEELENPPEASGM